MSWVKVAGILGNSICTQFENSGGDELNPQTLFSDATFVSDNTKASQNITYLNFDPLTYTTINNTKVQAATASSGLTVTYVSSDTDIGDFTGSTLTLYSAGVITITATQSGDGSYDSATPIYCIVIIVREDLVTGPTTYLSTPISSIANTTKSTANVITIVVDDTMYTSPNGISYCYDTGFTGAVMVGSITVLNTLSNPITDFTSDPLNVSFTIPHANTSNVLKIYKRDTATTMSNPQPTGYPATLTYNSPYWTGSLTNLSDIVILDETPPVGSAGGDPYIKAIDGVTTLIPNNWNRVLLYQNESVSVIGYCDFLGESIINNLHYIQKSTGIVLEIDKDFHKWVTDITYFVRVEFIDRETSKKLLIDTINGVILYDNSKFIYDTVNSINKYGLYSMTHNGWYPIYNLKKYIVYFNGGQIILSIDNFWDDINHMELYINTCEKNIKGELVVHDESNCLIVD